METVNGLSKGDCIFSVKPGRNGGIHKDIVLGRFAFNALLALTDNSHFQYQEGCLPEEHWLGVRSTIGGVMAGSSVLRDHVEATHGQRRPAFRDELIDILREIDEDSTPGRIRD